MMGWDAKSFADALDWQWDQRGGEYRGLCPLHDASGSHRYNAGIKDGKNETVVFHCFAKCSAREFFAEMERRGFDRPKRTTPQTDRPTEVERYPYVNENGDILYYNIRYQPKTFKMAQPHPSGEGLKWTTKDLPRRVIYRLPEILEATHTTFFCEGEKDVHTLERLGMTATCIAGGADGWTKYATDYIKQLAGQDLVILPHNDDAGARLAQEVAASLRQVTKRLRILDLPGRPPRGGDVTDWVQAGGTAEQLWQLLQNLEPPEDTNIVEIEAADLMRMTFRPIRWFAAGLLHEGMVLFGGKSKRGKSWVMMNLALSVSMGTKVFGHYEVPERTRVLYCALEDGPRRTQRRLRQIDPDADFSYIKFAFRMPPLDEGGVEYIARHIQEGFGVIVVDVLAHVETAGKHGLRDYHEVYRTFAPLQALRSQYQFALVMVTHLRKAESEEVFDNLHGSVAYQGTQDALWVMERKQGEEIARLHLRDKDAEDKIAELKFDGMGLWSFVGEGEEYAESQEEHQVLQFLMEEKRPQTIKEIMQGIGAHPGRYQAFRQRLHRMVSKGLILRSDRGRYVALRDWDDPEF